MPQHLIVSGSGHATTIQEIIATLGAPVSFARQYPVIRTEGVPVERIGGGPEAGIFRYLLRAGARC